MVNRNSLSPGWVTRGEKARLHEYSTAGRYKGKWGILCWQWDIAVWRSQPCQPRGRCFNTGNIGTTKTHGLHTDQLRELRETWTFQSHGNTAQTLEHFSRFLLTCQSCCLGWQGTSFYWLITNKTWSSIPSYIRTTACHRPRHFLAMQEICILTEDQNKASHIYSII